MPVAYLCDIVRRQQLFVRCFAMSEQAHRGHGDRVRSWLSQFLNRSIALRDPVARALRTSLGRRSIFRVGDVDGEVVTGIAGALLRHRRHHKRNAPAPRMSGR